MSGVVRCKQHGDQSPIIVCQHLRQAWRDSQPRGELLVAEHEDGGIDAYCDICEDCRIACGGEWSEDAYENVMKLKVICAACFEEIRRLYRSGED